MWRVRKELLWNHAWVWGEKKIWWGKEIGWEGKIWERVGGCCIYLADHTAFALFFTVIFIAVHRSSSRFTSYILFRLQWSSMLLFIVGQLFWSLWVYCLVIVGLCAFGILTSTYFIFCVKGCMLWTRSQPMESTKLSNKKEKEILYYRGELKNNIFILLWSGNGNSIFLFVN